MDNSKWAFAPDAPEWPVNARGEKEKAVLLTSTFDSTADADMLISLLAAYRIPCFKYFDYEGGSGKGHQRLFRLRRQPVWFRPPCWRTPRKFWRLTGGGSGAAPGVIEGKEIF